MQVLEGDSSTKEELRRQERMERERVIQELRSTLGCAARNSLWQMLVTKGKPSAHREDVKEHAEALIYSVRDSPSFQKLVDDLKILLQRLVGKCMSVDPLFDYSKGAFDDIVNNEELRSLVNEMQQTLLQIADNPELIDDPSIQTQLQSLSQRADSTIQLLLDNPNVKGAKEEIRKITDVLKNEPTSKALLNDLKRLWQDMSSDKPGEALDPEAIASIRKLIVPLLIEHLNNVPLPTVSDKACMYRNVNDWASLLTQQSVYGKVYIYH